MAGEIPGVAGLDSFAFFGDLALTAFVASLAGAGASLTACGVESTSAIGWLLVEASTAGAVLRQLNARGNEVGNNSALFKSRVKKLLGNTVGILLGHFCSSLHTTTVSGQVVYDKDKSNAMVRLRLSFD